MAVASFTELLEHVGHEVEVAQYGDPAVNVAVECQTCGEVLFDYDADDDPGVPVIVPGVGLRMSGRGEE